MMFRQLSTLAVAALVIGGLTYTFAPAEQPGGTGGTAGQTGGADRAADRTGGQQDSQGITQSMARCIDAAITPNGWQQLVQCFSSADQKRFEQGQSGQGAQGADRPGQAGAQGNDRPGQAGQAGRDQPGQAGQMAQNQSQQRYQKAVTDFQRIWRERYNGEFRIANADQVFGPQFARPMTGGIDTARPAGGRIEGSGSGTSGQGGTSDTGGTTGSGKTDKTGSGTTGSGTTGTGGTSGTMGQSSNVMIQASHGLPELASSWVKEGNDWKLNVPDTVTAEKLQDNLARHLTMINQLKDTLPKDQAEAQRVVAHHVFMAFYDRDLRSDREGAGQGGARTGAGQGGSTGGNTGGNR